MLKSFLDRRLDPFRPASGPPPGTLVAFTRWALAGAWPVLGIFVVLSILAGGMDTLNAFLLGYIIDTAVEAGPSAFFTQHMPVVIAFVAFFLLLRPAILGLGAFANAVLVQPFISPLILSRLNTWVLGQSVSYFDDDFAGRIAQKQMQTANAMTNVAVEGINVVIFGLAALASTFVLLGSIDWRITLLFAVWLIGYFALIRYFLPRIRQRSGKMAGARAMVSGQVVDTITNIKTVKLFAHAGNEEESAKGAMAGYREARLHLGTLSASFRFFLMGCAGVLPVMMIGASLMLWQAGQATEGDIVAAGTIAIRLAQMTGWLSFALMGIYANVGEVENGIKTLARFDRITDAEGARDLTVREGQVHFDGVSFSYGRDIGGVRNVDLTIHPGEKLGIVGASGAGKSTLVSLLLRLYDPEGGRVLIDGQDVAEVTQDSLRRQIGMVTQETAMFNRSARENILYGRPDATEEELIAAAKKAEAHEFIQDLADGQGRSGYDAHLGERGVKLSGGQRQRIALARAILKDAPILVLDEATSALDSEVEASIQTALERVMEGKTVLAIAHRLSTLSEMDRIIVMDQGEMVESGTHEELLALGGRYAQFWARQSGGFIGTEDEEATQAAE
jgi:ATP-binding cassette subfamily B protein